MVTIESSKSRRASCSQALSSGGIAEFTSGTVAAFQSLTCILPDSDQQNRLTPAWHFGVHQLSLSDDFFDDVTFEECEAFVPTEVPVGEFVLVEAQLMKHRRVDVAEVVR